MAQQQQDFKTHRPEPYTDGVLCGNRNDIDRTLGDTTPSAETLLSYRRSQEAQLESCFKSEDVSNIPRGDGALTDNSKFYPEGGYGWLVLAGTFVIAFWALGVNFDWGVFEEHLDRKASFNGADAKHLSWVGGISSASLFIGGPAIVFLISRLGTKAVLASGAVLMAAGYIIGSFANDYWHLYITTGFMFGFGGSLQYFTALNVLAGYFNKRRGLVVGVAVAGAGIGASVLAPLMRWIVSEIDFRWTFRIVGGCMLLFTAIAACIIRPYDPATSSIHNKVTDPESSKEKDVPTTAGEAVADIKHIGSGTSSSISHTSAEAGAAPESSHTQQRALGSHENGSLDFRILLVPGYALVFFSSILCAFAYMVPILVAPSYATSIGLSAADGATMLTITSSVNFISRVLLGYISDRCGVLNIAIICGIASGLSCLLVWTHAKTFAAMAVFMAFYGAFAGPSIMLLPVAATRAVDSSRISSALGFSFFAHSIGYILGPPMTQRVIEAQNGSYTGAIIVVGTLNMLGAVLLLAARFHADRRLWVPR
ncbi:hypothetical protein BGZ65_011691 [Modicella reniformis]|uniref:Major facilitator superfamily (MFS) profile domain-containing protein n=1 Tax=Modicella reniformis TaxID=1440133 RepID=A0A9P6SUL2_9FUNG|nr:hypothetical protein BGZ65_011691 [Modicella reniformis]